MSEYKELSQADLKRLCDAMNTGKSPQYAVTQCERMNGAYNNGLKDRRELTEEIKRLNLILDEMRSSEDGDNIAMGNMMDPHSNFNIINTLIYATQALLRDYNYDKTGWEGISIALDKAIERFGYECFDCGGKIKDSNCEECTPRK